MKVVATKSHLDVQMPIQSQLIKEGQQHSEKIFEILFKDKEKANAFTLYMAVIQKQNFENVATKVDFKNHKVVVDIGGCLGAFLVSIKRHNPHLICKKI